MLEYFPVLHSHFFSHFLSEKCVVFMRSPASYNQHFKRNQSQPLDIRIFVYCTVCSIYCEFKREIFFFGLKLQIIMNRNCAMPRKSKKCNGTDNQNHNQVKWEQPNQKGKKMEQKIIAQLLRWTQFNYCTANL